MNKFTFLIDIAGVCEYDIEGAKICACKFGEKVKPRSNASSFVYMIQRGGAFNFS